MEITPDILHLIKAALTEDLGDKGDITTRATIPEDKIITATMNARENGIIAGLDIAKRVFEEIDPTLKLTAYVQDGDTLSPNQKIMDIHGKARNILEAERVALNFVSHLSGIASETAKYVAAVAGTKAKILDTRKTLPAYRMIHKHAVKMGGGTNHRFGLYDMILIKDNHIASAGSITAALDGAVAADHGVKIEIEVDTLEQLQDVLDHGGADIVLLDNMPPSDLKTAVSMIKGKLISEASGGVNLNSVRAIAESGVDLISIGALTHSVTVLDIGLDIHE